MMRQCPGCAQASVQGVPPSVQKTGMPLPWHFFVHSAAVTRINTGPFGMYTAVHGADPCTHVCVQGVYERVYRVCPAHTHRKGEGAWRPVS
jgi:hypothetical protein